MLRQALREPAQVIQAETDLVQFIGHALLIVSLVNAPQHFKGRLEIRQRFGIAAQGLQASSYILQAAVNV